MLVARARGASWVSTIGPVYDDSFFDDTACGGAFDPAAYAM